MTAPDVVAALDRFAANRIACQEDLKRLIRIPSISFPGYDAAPLRQCADAVATLFRDSGLTDVRLLESGSGPPAVFAQWTEAPGMPVLLLYAHYDVQPIGRSELWTSPPFSPEEREGRLYGRGASDDKAGVALFAAALGSYLHTAGRLPVNVKLLVEGEEEVGSSHLDAIIERNRDLLAADAVLIADSENFDSGIPTLTASLRGLVTVNVTVRALASSVHSGTWGGPLPDAVIALCKMIAGLVDDDGVPTVPGMLDRLCADTPQGGRKTDELPFQEKHFREQAGMLDGTRIIGGPGSVYDKMWRRAAISVNAFEASSRKQASNIINDRAWARLGVRIAPDMDPEETLETLSAHLRRSAPWGVEVTIEPESPAQWWKTDTEGPVFAAALRALAQGYGKSPVVAGAGGSIPFVQTITEALHHAPALLVGMGDPFSAAHSENESLLLADWEKGCRSLIYLLGELAPLAPR